jgi:hypothetical protein
MMLVPLSYLIGTRKPSLNCHNLNRVQIVQNQLHLMHNLIVRAPVKLQNPNTIPAMGGSGVFDFRVSGFSV